MKITDLIGCTPLVRLREIERKYLLEARVYAKLEMFNPSHSVKDRAALYMIKDGVKNGLIDGRTKLIEPTSGNMGISLSMLSAFFGYSAVIVMPEGMSIERRKMIEAYGGAVILTKGEMGMRGAVEMAERLLCEIPNAYTPSQFENPNNSLAHYETTGPEIYAELDGRVDVFIAGVGTGGTLMGVGRYLKERDPSVKIVAVEPRESAVLSCSISGTHGIQGIGAGFVPPLIDMSIIDEIVQVSSDDALNYTGILTRNEGILAGISSGAVLSATILLAEREENEGKNIVTLFPDSGEKYLSIL